MSANKSPAQTTESIEDKYAMSGFFNISSMARQKIADKRKRKGLGDLKPREKSVYGQIFVHGTTLSLVKTLGAPLERCRIIMQTSHMQNLKPQERLQGSTMSLITKISNEQGISQFWRGNNANLYKTWTQLLLNIFLYDKTKNAFMPYETNKYKGLDFFWRSALSSIFCMGTTTFLVYPFDLIHTRIATDITKKGQPRLFTTTFDCFNRTHLDEGRWGVFKGFQLALISSVLRASFTLPLYDTLKQSGFLQPKDTDTQFDKFSQRLGPSFLTSMILSVALYPFDTIKRCLQLNGGRGQLVLYRGVGDAIQKFVQYQGYRALYKGVHLFFIKELICAFAQVNIYEAIKPQGLGLE